MDKKARFNSLSTPGLKQDCSNYLVELVFLRKNDGKKLEPRFWTSTKYKFRFSNEIKACRKFIKKYGEAAVLHVAIHNYITTWTDFATLEVLLQNVVERKKRLAAPKDLSEVAPTEKTSKRNFTFTKQHGYFERLKELRDE